MLHGCSTGATLWNRCFSEALLVALSCESPNLMLRTPLLSDRKIQFRYQFDISETSHRETFKRDIVYCSFLCYMQHDARKEVCNARVQKQGVLRCSLYKRSPLQSTSTIQRLYLPPKSSTSALLIERLKLYLSWAQSLGAAHCPAQWARWKTTSDVSYGLNAGGDIGAAAPRTYTLQHSPHRGASCRAFPRPRQ